MAESEETIWTIKRCLDWTVDYLGQRGQEHPRVSAEWMLCAATGLDRVALYTHFDQPLSPEELRFMHEGIVRRGRGEPLQYITGETAFRSLSLACEPGVLIPRPETELLVDLVLKYIDEQVTGPWEPRRARVELPWNAAVEAARKAELAAKAAEASEDEEPGAGQVEASDGALPGDDGRDAGADAQPALACARVLEVGCGTGCISLSLASERLGRISCVATDIEERAVNLARRNRERCGVSPEAVDIRRGDLVSPVLPEEVNSFDVLVSNPPYIPTEVMGTLPHEVADYEPHLALDGGADGLRVFRRLVYAAPQMLKPGGLLACELFEGALEEAEDICRCAHMERVQTIHDLTGRPRFIFAHTRESADEAPDGTMRP